MAHRRKMGLHMNCLLKLFCLDVEYSKEEVAYEIIPPEDPLDYICTLNCPQPALLSIKDDLSIHIFSFLPEKDIYTIGLVNKKWLAMTKNSKLNYYRRNIKINQIVKQIRHQMQYKPNDSIIGLNKGFPAEFYIELSNNIDLSNNFRKIDFETQNAKNSNKKDNDWPAATSFIIREINHPKWNGNIDMYPSFEYKFVGWEYIVIKSDLGQIDRDLACQSVKKLNLFPNRRLKDKF